MDITKPQIQQKSRNQNPIKLLKALSNTIKIKSLCITKPQIQQKSRNQHQIKLLKALSNTIKIKYLYTLTKTKNSEVTKNTKSKSIYQSIPKRYSESTPKLCFLTEKTAEYICTYIGYRPCKRTLNQRQKLTDKIEVKQLFLKKETRMTSNTAKFLHLFDSFTQMADFFFLIY